MTITQETSALLIVTCGSTGIQSGSAIKALRESDKAYHMCSLTFDPTKLVLPQLSSAFFFGFFCSFFVTENVVIDATVQEMVTNIAPLHTFQILKFFYQNTCSQS